MSTSSSNKRMRTESSEGVGGSSSVHEDVVEDVTDMVNAGLACATAFNCDICNTFIDGKIYQCMEGHTIWCSPCDIKIRAMTPGARCPTCRMSTLDSVRNRSLERMAVHQLRPCPHEGCKEQGTAKKLKEHALVCAFVPYRCENDSCEYEDNDRGNIKTHKTRCA